MKYMVLNVKTLAEINLAVQLFLIVVLAIAAYLAKKRMLGNHCAVIRVAVPVQILAVVGVMLPSMLGYLGSGMPVSFNLEVLVHHTLGLAVILLWICINLVFAGFIKTGIKLVTFMRFAFGLWVLALLLGLHMYVRIYI